MFLRFQHQVVQPVSSKLFSESPNCSCNGFVACVLVTPDLSFQDVVMHEPARTTCQPMQQLKLQRVAQKTRLRGSVADREGLGINQQLPRMSITAFVGDWL